MQIFATDPCPYTAAKNLDNKRLVKMCVETAQILQTAAHARGAKTTYKPTHMNHPAVKWTKECKGNYLWLFRHWGGLVSEYSARYGRTHKSTELFLEMCDHADLFPGGEKLMTPHVPISFTLHPGQDVYDGYKEYLQTKLDKKAV